MPAIPEYTPVLAAIPTKEARVFSAFDSSNAVLITQNLPENQGISTVYLETRSRTYFESACKLIIKHRMCGPGMRWGHRAADHVLALRCLLHSDGMWRVVWSKPSP